MFRNEYNESMLLSELKNLMNEVLEKRIEVYKNEHPTHYSRMLVFSGTYHSRTLIWCRDTQNELNNCRSIEAVIKLINNILDSPESYVRKDYLLERLAEISNSPWDYEDEYRVEYFK